MALDPSGNIYVTGFSQNIYGNLGYLTIKYAPNGNQVWAARCDSTSYPSATPAALVLDSSNNVIVTGSALTIKYDLNGNQVWTSPYAGADLACDLVGDLYVAGFGTNFNTVKLSPAGSNLWLGAYTDVGPTISQSVLVDSGNNVYVSGLDSYVWMPTSESNPQQGWWAVALTTIKYGSSGTQLWKASQTAQQMSANVQVAGAAFDNATNLYLVGNFSGAVSQAYLAFRYANNGNLVWKATPSRNGYSLAHAVCVDQNQSLLIAGQIPSNFLPDNFPLFSYGTVKLATNGSTLWSDLYPSSADATNVANSLAIDQANNSYVTGYSPGTNSSNDIVTIKYGSNGNQIWLQRYHGPGNGNDAGNAIAVDNNGNVYVTGYEATTAGGTEIVTIKYSAVTLQKLADGSFLLEAQGSPGESFDIRASADLLHWLDLGSAMADTNGLMQFDDTNAANFPARFYHTNPQ